AQLAGSADTVDTDRPHGMGRTRWQRAMIAASALAAGAVVWFAVGEPFRTGPDAPGLVEPAAGSMEAVPVALEPTPTLNETREALIADVYERLAALPPETRSEVVKNLNTINEALDQIDRALEEAPDSGLDRRLLMSMYADQITMLTGLNAVVRHANRETAL
ncbi:MAG: hypothetical protein P8Y69_14465, partial [Gammaproteobacteria bacterium]